MEKIQPSKIHKELQARITTRIKERTWKVFFFIAWILVILGVSMILFIGLTAQHPNPQQLNMRKMQVVAKQIDEFNNDHPLVINK